MSKKAIIPVPVRGKQLKAYFMEHVTLLYGSFYRVTKPLPVFKSVLYGRDYSTRAIVNLLIPIGATIHADYRVFECYSTLNGRKMRANKAYVHSIAKKDGTIVQSGRSGWNPNFRYRTGRNVKPDISFFMCDEKCASGIHFFLNLADAAAWY